MPTEPTPAGLTAEAIAEIRALAQRAPEGPYEAERSVYGDWTVDVPDTHPRSVRRLGRSEGSGGYCRGYVRIVVNTDPKCEPPTDEEGFARYVAALDPETVLALLAAHDALAAERDRLAGRLAEVERRLAFWKDHEDAQRERADAAEQRLAEVKAERDRWYGKALARVVERNQAEARAEALAGAVHRYGEHVSTPPGPDWSDLARREWRERRTRLFDAMTDAAGALLAPAPAGPSLEAVLAEVVAWGFETFPTSTPVSAATHLLKEARELAAAPTSAEEIADVLMLAAHVKARVLQWAARAGVDPARAVADKLAVCRTRTWKAPDADGVVEHERGAPEAPGPRPATLDVTA